MKYYLSQSFGKDSLCQAIIAAEMGEPIDGAIYCEVMYTDQISGEIPEHRDFIYNVAIPKLEKDYGIKTTVLRSDRTMKDLFYHVSTKGKSAGKVIGFPIPGRCAINRDCKMRAIKAWKRAQTEPITMYVGIAADEPNRLARMKEGSVSLLAKYGITEEMAVEICRERGLLSPIYSFAKRNGCWFCPNMTKNELLNIYYNHRELWNDLLSMQDTPDLVYPYWARGKTLYDVQAELQTPLSKKQYREMQRQRREHKRG